MKVIAINGSPRAKGNTAAALRMVGEEIEKEGIEVEYVHIGLKTPRGCMCCYGCVKSQDERCVIQDDLVNDLIQKVKNAEGLLIASPEYYASVSGGIKSALDRMFFVAGMNGGLFRGKVASAIGVARRSGGMGAFIELSKYLLYAEMIVATSMYWAQIFGQRPDEVEQDEEGKQTMRVLGKNMAWLLKMKEATKDTLPQPPREEKVAMNFIR